MTYLTIEIIFWACIGAVFYNYVGYPLILFGLSALYQAKTDLRFLFGEKDRRNTQPADVLPRVAVLMSAYNEEAVIEAKAKNLLDLDYPQERLEIFIGLDAPTDATARLLEPVQSDHFHVIHYSDRQGKLKVLSALAQRTTAEVLVITDADANLERKCIRHLARHFVDPRVGAVSGEAIRLVGKNVDPGAEALYWKYESALRFLENRINCSIGSVGCVLAVRNSLFRQSKPSIVEDLQIPLDIRFSGYRVVYDPEAIATEGIAPNFSAQFVRRVRVGAGNFQTLFTNFKCLNPKHRLLAFSFFSHRVLRWLAPFFLIIAFLCSVLMVGRLGFAALLVAQIAFYSAALLGYWLKARGKRAGLLTVPFHFCLMNLALFLGLFKYLRGSQSLTWTSPPREMQREVGMKTESQFLIKKTS
jgi:cellulose synthase/poly-beta-1,6-N-acetylglucosamine synthase-like glycosyltransferase